MPAARYVTLAFCGALSACAPSAGAPTQGEIDFSWGVAAIKAPAAWRLGATGRGVAVAVIDAGVDAGHPELARATDLTRSKDVNAARDALTGPLGHGSEAAALIAAAPNGADGVGIAYDSTIIAIRADNLVGGFDAADLAAALDHARESGARIISMSLGDPDETSSAASPQVAAAIARATRAGVLIVVSAGNFGNVGAATPTFPARFAADPQIANGLMIVAGGLNPDGERNPASNPPGPARDVYVMAPGWGLSAPLFSGCAPPARQCEDRKIGGTSFAAAHVAAAAADIMSLGPLSAAATAAILLESADDSGAPGADDFFGRGTINLERATKRARERTANQDVVAKP